MVASYPYYRGFNRRLLLETEWRHQTRHHDAVHGVHRMRHGHISDRDSLAGNLGQFTRQLLTNVIEVLSDYVLRCHCFDL